MSELEDKLNSILGDPQAMSQIMSLARSLGGGVRGTSASFSAAQPQSAPEPSPSQQPQGKPSDSSPPPVGPDPEIGLDPRLLALAGRIMAEYRADDNEKAALLQALRPFVAERRYAKLDKAVQIARLSRVIRVALDVLKGGGGSV